MGTGKGIGAAVLAAMVLTAGPAAGGGAPQSLIDALCTWTDHPANPLIHPPGIDRIIADPTVVAPDESPDGRWHLFAHSLFAIHHYLSDDGIAWTRLRPGLFGPGRIRPFIFLDEGIYYLFFERIWSFTDSELRVSTSLDLMTWTEPAVVLGPTLAWETGAQHTTGNPYVTKRDGLYWLYYSADGVYLPDTGFYEPKFIGLARSASPLGPYEKMPEPILGPDWREPYRNYGAGSIKLLDETVEGRTIALHNGISFDFEGRTRSAIQVLSSEDGVHWETVCAAPILAPTDEGWKKSFVYAFDTARAGDEIRVYFNAREGWRRGVERIGVATLNLPR